MFGEKRVIRVRGWKKKRYCCCVVQDQEGAVLVVDEIHSPRDLVVRSRDLYSSTLVCGGGGQHFNICKFLIESAEADIGRLNLNGESSLWEATYNTQIL